MVRSKGIFLIIVCLLLPILSMAAPSTFGYKMKMGAAVSLGPVLKAGGKVVQKINRLSHGIKRYGALIGANEELRRQVAELTQEVVRLKEVSVENERLRDLLSFKEQIPYKVISARVIARDSTNWYSTIVIDKGTEHNVIKNMPLITPLGLVGKVTEVSPFLSRCMLIVDPNSRVGAMVERSREVGVVEGYFKGLCRMKYISNNADIKEGDLIISSGSGGIFPKGIAIGKVKSIGTDFGGLYLSASVEPLADFSRLEEVLCVVRTTQSSF